MSYLSLGASDIAKAGNDACRLVRKNIKDDFDTIVVRGASGLLVSGIVAARLKKNICIIRKEHESSHAWGSISHSKDFTSYIILDDFIGSGETMNAIFDRLLSVKKITRDTCKGIILYDRVNSDLVNKAEAIHFPRHLIFDLSNL